MLGKKKKNTDETPFDGEAGTQLKLIKEMLENTQANIKKALELINEKEIDPAELITSLQDIKQATEYSGADVESSSNERIIEGVFNGEKMIASDGVEYNVPPNYASKSKLVEGDILKLTISRDGSFIYKQIGPIERKQMVSTLAQNDVNGQWYAVSGNKRWKLITASVTYFHGQPGYEVVIIIPKEGKSNYAAVENVIKSAF